jgi:nitric oxide synthase oxygenase domain/subunit
MFGSFPDELLERFKASYAERAGKPCGGSHIPANKTCHIGGGAGYKDVTEAIRADVGSSFDDAHEKVFEDRYAKAKDTKDLGRIHKKAIKDLDNDDLDAKEGVLNAMKKAMQDHLEANMASGQGAKREAELAAMTPEERAKALSTEAIQRGIKNKVVSGRR